MINDVITSDVGFDEKQKILDYSKDLFLDIYSIYVRGNTQIEFKDITKSEDEFNVKVSTEDNKSLTSLLISANDIKTNFPKLNKINDPEKLAILGYALVDLKYNFTMKLTLENFNYVFEIPFVKLITAPSNLRGTFSQRKDLKLVRVNLLKDENSVAVYSEKFTFPEKIYHI